MIQIMQGELVASCSAMRRTPPDFAAPRAPPNPSTVGESSPVSRIASSSSFCFGCNSMARLTVATAGDLTGRDRRYCYRALRGRDAAHIDDECVAAPGFVAIRGHRLTPALQYLACCTELRCSVPARLAHDTRGYEQRFAAEMPRQLLRIQLREIREISGCIRPG